MGYLVAAGPAVSRGEPVDLRHALVPAIVGSFTPDIIDKPLRALELVPYARSLGHSVFFLAAVYLLWWILDRRNVWCSRAVGWWVVGIATHYFADIANDFFRGLEARGYLITAWPFWPITDARSHAVLYEIGDHIRIHPFFSSLEIGVFALTTVVLYAQWLQVQKGGGMGR